MGTRTGIPSLPSHEGAQATTQEGCITSCFLFPAYEYEASEIQRVRHTPVFGLLFTLSPAHHLGYFCPETYTWDTAPRDPTPCGDWKGDRRPLKQSTSILHFQTLGLDSQYLELHRQAAVCMHHTKMLPLLNRAWKPLTGKDDNYHSNSCETISNSLCLVAPATTRAC